MDTVSNRSYSLSKLEVTAIRLYLESATLQLKTWKYIFQLSKLEICSKITDVDLLELKASFLILEDTAVTTKGVNKLLKVIRN